MFRVCLNFIKRQARLEKQLVRELIVLFYVGGKATPKLIELMAQRHKIF
jgi:hypothetical protein